MTLPSREFLLQKVQAEGAFGKSGGEEAYCWIDREETNLRAS
jgi:hypothetical protein